MHTHYIRSGQTNNRGYDMGVPKTHAEPHIPHIPHIPDVYIITHNWFSRGRRHSSLQHYNYQTDAHRSYYA